MAKKRGYVRSGFFLLAGIACLWGGGQALYTLITNPDPLQMTCAEYIEKRPEGKWLQLTECSLYVEDSMYTGSTMHYGPYVPVRAKGSTGEEPIVIVLDTKDSQILSLLGEAREAAHEGDEAIIKYMADNLELFHQERIIEGTVQLNIVNMESDDDDKQVLIDLYDKKNISEDFVIIKDGEKPTPVLALIMFVFGILSALFIWVLGRPESD